MEISAKLTSATGDESSLSNSANCDCHEQHEYKRLNYLNGRFRLGWCDGLKHRHLAEQLNHKDKDVEVERDNGGDREGSSPPGCEIMPIHSETGKQHKDQRQEADGLRGRETPKREEE